MIISKCDKKNERFAKKEKRERFVAGSGGGIVGNKTEYALAVRERKKGAEVGRSEKDV